MVRFSDATRVHEMLESIACWQPHERWMFAMAILGRLAPDGRLPAATSKLLEMYQHREHIPTADDDRRALEDALHEKYG